MTIYLIKFILCSSLLLFFYHLFLQKEKLHQFNRFYLLAGIVLSLTIPLVTITFAPQTVAEYSEVAGVQDLNPYPFPVKIPTDIPVQADDASADIEKILIGLYGAISLILLIRFAKNISTIMRKKSGKKIIDYHGARLVLLPEDVVTYTFLNYIFVSEKAFRNGEIEPEILTHELAHVRQKHTVDILFMELLLIIFWINPVLIFYKKAIRLNHEFLADQAVLAQFRNVKNYQLLLLDKILYTRQINLTSSFNYSITRNRLEMMTKNSNRMLQILKKCAVSLLTIGLVFAFCEKIYSQEKKISPKQKSQPTAKSEKSSISDNPNTAIRRRYKSPGAGLTQEEMKEFNSTVEKHKVSGKDIKGRPYVDLKLSVVQKNRMYDLFCKMNAEQHENNQWEFFQMPIPVKSSPTPEIFELWKNPKVMGVWLNGKKINNSELGRYKHTDIAEYSLSKLYGAAKKGRVYKYQLDLTTNEEFDKTYDTRVADRILVMSHQYFQPKP